MINNVQGLVEALARFDARARLTNSLEVDGISPATACTVEVIDSVSRIEELENELENAENEAEKQEETIDKLRCEIIDKDGELDILKGEINDLKMEIQKLEANSSEN